MFCGCKSTSLSFSSLFPAYLPPAGCPPPGVGLCPYGCPHTDFPWGARLHLLPRALPAPQHQQQLAPRLGRLWHQCHWGLWGRPAQPHQHLPCHSHHHHRCLLGGLRCGLGGKLPGHVCHHKVRGFGYWLEEAQKTVPKFGRVGEAVYYGSPTVRSWKKATEMTQNLSVTVVCLHLC